MATRFYLTQLTPSITNTAVNAGWNVTTGLNRFTLARLTFIDRLSTNFVSGQVGAAAPRKCIWQQFVSFPLQPQTLNGTVDAQIRMIISSVTSRSGQGFIYFRVLHPNGTITDVGTMNSTVDLVITTFTNRTFTQLSLSSVTIIAGDRLIFEIGWNYLTGSNTTTTGSINLNTGNAQTDLPVDNTSTAVQRPWIEFSQNILFQNQSGFFF